MNRNTNSNFKLSHFYNVTLERKHKNKNKNKKIFNIENENDLYNKIGLESNKYISIKKSNIG